MNKKFILVLNCGSSSIKYAVIEPQLGTVEVSGLAQRIGTPQASIDHRDSKEKSSQEFPNIDYRSAVQEIVRYIRKYDHIFAKILAVGHRVVHGAEHFSESVLITQEIIEAIRASIHLAPLHNPANIVGIEEAQKVFPSIPQVAVFDTAFHQTMPSHAYVYPIPYDYYKKKGVRRYGFHGTSHRYVCQQAATMLNKPLEKCSLITAHLGNGCSAAAILHGKSIDTTMGLTPLEGLMMGTRCGDVDPSVLAYLVDNLGYDIHRITEILNKESGLFGVAGVSGDMRSIEERMANGDRRAHLAFEIFCYRLAKYIGALAIPLGSFDAIVFTGGIGENSDLVRARTIEWLKIFDLHLDAKRNSVHGKNSNGIITVEGGRIAMVVKTNEELLIARDAAMIAKNLNH